MDLAFYYLALSGILTVLLWAPYILSRLFVVGLSTFLNNYPEGFPKQQPEQPLWAVRAQRAHLNMVETLPAFVSVVLAAYFLIGDNFESSQMIGQWAQVFFFARVIHAAVYILGIPYLRTPIYLVSWASILMIGFIAIG